MDVLPVVEKRCKKKYRDVSGLCHAYGFQPQFFAGIEGATDSGSITGEARYGLHLNVRRCHARSVGSQVFKALFFLTKLDFHMDDELLDALAETEECKDAVFDWYESSYHDSIRRE